MQTTQDLLKKINEAFAVGNTDFLLKNVTEDFTWTIIGDSRVKGKKSFQKILKEMEGPRKIAIDINEIIIQGSKAAVNGKINIKLGETRQRQYSFCDIYHLTNDPKPKLKALISYVINENKKNKKS